MRKMKSLLSLALLIALCATAFANGRDRLILELFMDWEYVASPQISPDGNQIVYTRRWTDKVNDRFESEIWIMNADGSKNRYLVKGSSPKWSPDGKRLAYVAPGQPQGAQVFVKWMDTGEETQLTRLERGPSNIEWSPDGKRIAFNMTVPASNRFTVRMPPRPAGAKWVEPPRVIDRLDYRADGAGFRPEGFTHIFVIPDTGGTPRQLTEGDYNHGSPQWTPDSQTILFSGVRKPDAEYLRGGAEIYSLNVATGQIKTLTDRNGPDFNPTVSPDGRLIAYTGYDQTDDSYTVSKLYLMEIDGQNKRMLAGEFDRSPTGLVWASDSSGIYFTAEDRGANNLWLVSVKGGAPRQITQGNHQLAVSSMTKTGLMAGVLTDPKQPGDVVVFNLKQPTPKKITAVNDDLLEGRRLGEVEEIWYDSVGGKRIQGWIVKPPDFDPSKKYPLILYIHGGPHSMYGVGFNFEFHNHAAEGYVVLYTNPRGSTGYGQEFGNAIKNNYP
ncbi:MAG TPA: DPP IV N-terminal domain-containing protein, partial [Blastocatellia bacterium]|nr:DPP IV N-terminal domain-containing protein [Blastocatellia bacterium]